MIRDVLGEDGMSANAPSADSPDIWVRRTDPSLDTSALPGGYDQAGPHEQPVYGSDSWVYGRVRNRGAEASYDAWVRFYVAVSDGSPLNYPEDWEPANGIGNVAPDSWSPGTYFVGELQLGPLASQTDAIVSVPWATELLPPVPDGLVTTILVEVTPHDGPLTGALVHENNNLAQKIVAIADGEPPAVSFEDEDGNPLSSILFMPTSTGFFGTNLDYMRIRVADAGYFNVESVTFTLEAFVNSGDVFTYQYVHNGSWWTPDSTGQGSILVEPGATGSTTGALFSPNSVPVYPNTTMVRWTVHVTDLSGNTTPNAQAQHVIHAALPTDVTLLLDFSGSMLQQDETGQNKWTSVREAAELFNVMFGALALPELDDRIAVVRFYRDGQTTETAVTASLHSPDPHAPLIELDDVPLARYMTPIGSALLAGHAEMSPAASNWRNRVMVLLTDGKENVDPRLSAIRQAEEGDPEYVPSLSQDNRGGYRIHSCAFGSDEDVDSEAIQALAIGGGDDDELASYSGQFHSTGSTGDPDDSFALKQQFLSILADSLPIEIIGPFDDTFEVEPGVREMVCVVTDEVDFAVNPPAAHGAPIGTASVATGFSWVRVTAPAPGTWSLSNFNASPGVRAFAVVDLTLRASFDAGREKLEIGQPIPLRAEIRENGIGVPDAEVQVRVEYRKESVGEILTNFASTTSYDPRSWGNMLARSRKSDAVRFRKKMLQEAIKQRGDSNEVASQALNLVESGEPGVYVGDWNYADVDGTYTFYFHASGRTLSGQPFQRDYVASRYLAPFPSSATTEATWDSVSGAGAWTNLVVRPMASNKLPLGPGLDRFLTIEFTFAKDRHRESIRVGVVDNLDGTYRAELKEATTSGPIRVDLWFGNRRVRLNPAKAGVATKAAKQRRQDSKKAGGKK